MESQPLAATLSSAAHAVERADVRVGRRLAQTRDHPLSRLAAQAGKLGDQEPLYALAAGLVLLGAVTRRPGLAMAGLRVGLAVAAADAAKSALKKSLTRTRPNVLLDEGRYEMGPGGSDEKPAQSFPSGHMAGTTAAAAAIARSFPGTTPYGALTAAALGVSRVSKGAHWPLDVAAGAAIGLMAETATARLVASAGRRLQPNRAIRSR